MHEECKVSGTEDMNNLETFSKEKGRKKYERVKHRELSFLTFNCMLLEMKLIKINNSFDLFSG